MDSHNQLKAEAVKDFVNMMIGARRDGFVQMSCPSLAEIHQTAKRHIEYTYDIETPNITDEWGEDVRMMCQSETLFSNDFYPPIGEPCLMLWNSQPLEYKKILPVGFDKEGFLVYEDLSETLRGYCRGYPHIKGDEHPKYQRLAPSNVA